jgi:hypothetical protein
MAESHEYNVVQFFPDGSHEYLKRGVGPAEAVDCARSYTLPTRPGVMIGIIDRVVITDGGDNCIFEWRNGPGVTWPPEFAGRK